MTIYHHGPRCRQETLKQKKNNRDPFVVRSRSALVQTTDDFERIIKVWPKCCSGIFYMQRKRCDWERSWVGRAGGGAGSGQRYWLLLGLQHHEHRSQSNNVIISLPLVMRRLPRSHRGGVGRRGREAKAEGWVDAEQMDNVSSCHCPSSYDESGG